MKEDSLMTLLRFELKRSRIALLIWSGSIALLLLICLIIFPDMKGQVNELNAAFSSMGSFTEAFGMDRLNMGELMGFYGLECGNILGIGGAFFAAYIGVSALAGEEKNHTAEYLLTHPISRSRIVIEKLLGIIIQILILNLSAVCVSLITIRLIGETPEMKEFFLLHTAYLLLQVEITAVCFFLSAFLRRSGIGIGLGLAAILYFLNIIANITEDAEWLDYITPFSYAYAADIIGQGALDPVLCGIGCGVTAAAVIGTFIVYTRKDIYA